MADAFDQDAQTEHHEGRDYEPPAVESRASVRDPLIGLTAVSDVPCCTTT
jgi:hypothetical protein